MANNANILYTYFEILKIIYKHKDGVTSSYFLKNLSLSKQNFSKYINQIMDSDFGKFIDVDTSSKTRVYRPALNNLDEAIKYYVGYKYTYDELLALENFKVYLKDKDEEEFLEKFKANFIVIDNPLQDEKLSKLEFNFILKCLKALIVGRKINIEYIDEDIKDAIFLKVIYSDKNWYILIKFNNRIELKRVAFIKNIDITKDRYPSFEIPENLNKKIKNLSNSLSLFESANQEAILEISPKIARYFQKDMKKFFKSQKIVNENPLQISITYSQELEILRFVKTWLPDIKIISPKSLQEAFCDNLKQALNNYKKEEL